MNRKKVSKTDYSKYPPDGGLREPFRNFKDIPSLQKVVAEHFLGKQD